MADLQAEYLKKARAAYERREYKYCLVLLKKVDLGQPANCALFVSCSYDYWKAACLPCVDQNLQDVEALALQPADLSAPPQRAAPRPGTGSAGGVATSLTPEQEAQYVRQVVGDSFTLLLGQGQEGGSPIAAADYVRLSHVYLAEGALDSALRIMQLASARGYLQDPLIVLQSWTIMRRISRDRDAHGAMRFLCSTILLDANQRKRNPSNPVAPEHSRTGRSPSPSRSTMGFSAGGMGMGTGTGGGFEVESWGGRGNSRGGGSRGGGSAGLGTFSSTFGSAGFASGGMGAGAGAGAGLGMVAWDGGPGSPPGSALDVFVQSFGVASRNASPQRLRTGGSTGFSRASSPDGRATNPGFGGGGGAVVAWEDGMEGTGYGSTRWSERSRGSERAAEKGYMVSGSSLPLYCLYLHCACYIYKQALQHTHNKTLFFEEMGQYNAILSEAYFMYSGSISEDAALLSQWANDAELWLQMGRELGNNTPFVLLSQDCFWEAFLRSSLSERPLRLHVASMRRNGRTQDVPQLLAQAMKANQWNLFARRALQGIELAVGGQEWAALIAGEDGDCARVQGAVRGWRLRKHWEVVRTRVALRKSLFQGRKTQALRRGALYWTGVRRRLWARWNLYVLEYKSQQYHAATMLQAYWRMRACSYWYAWQRVRIYQANTLFLPVAQRHHDAVLALGFRHLHAMHMQLLHRRTADLLLAVLFANGYSRMLRDGMDFILSVMRVKKRHTYKRIFGHWDRRKRARARKHARVTIRFFVRDVCMRVWQRAETARLAELLKTLEKKKEVDFKQNNLPLIREKWDHWGRVFAVVRLRKKLERLSVNLARAFYRRRGRTMLRAVRARREAQRAMVALRWHRKAMGLLLPWRRCAAMGILQRGVRCWRARRVVKRLRGILKGVIDMAARRRERGLRRVLWRWHKHNYLAGREQLRASRRVVRAMRRMMHRALLSRCQLKKRLALGLLDSLHAAHLHMCLRRLLGVTLHAAKMRKLTALCGAALMGLLRGGFHRWASTAAGQGVVLGLLRGVLRPLEARYWQGAAAAVRVRPLLEMRHTLPLAASALDAGLKPFEQVVLPSRVLHACPPALQLRLALSSWMAAFRLRVRHLRDCCRPRAEAVLLRACRGVQRRRAGAVALQAWARGVADRRKARGFVGGDRRHAEQGLAVSHRHIAGILLALRAQAVLRAQARCLLQQFGRRVLALGRRDAQQQYCGQLQAAAMVVGSSLLQRSLVLRAMRGMQIAYCRAVHAQLMLVRQGRQRPSAAGAASAAARLRFKGGGRGGGRGEGGGDQTRPGRQGEGSDGESVEEDGEEGWEGEGEEDGEGQFLSQTQLALRRKERARRQRKISRDRYPERQKRAPLHLPQASRTAQSSAGLGMGMVGAGTRVGLGLSGMGGTAGARARQQSLRDDTLSLKDPSFRSPQCHRHLLRLSQTGVFVYDAASMGAAPSASGLSPNALTAEEVCFCLQHAETVFLQGTRKALLRNVAAHFQGSKLVLVGGALAAGAVSELLAGLLREEREQATEGAGVGVVGEGAGVEESLSLHLSAVRMGTAARLSLLLSLLDAPPSYAGSSSRVCGVAVDSDSLGLLGCALLCRVLRYNSRLTSLAIKLGEAGAIGGGGGEVPHCLAEGLQLLSGNPALRDLRLFGAALPEAAVQALLHGIRGAFPCLALLEFSVQLGGGAAEAAEAVVEAAKDRAFAGRQGVSVTVNYR